ncbi:MAG: AmmeMemoRadiSam system protein B [Gammaproteobacteria bacterium]|nr:AmmeMemoRadiSam system protein B [Gammaproteobacteria bacterium]MDE2345730.1 AmmeMemoRadiSam system protein B [Gammaproteobacteria bacterium]
MTKHGMIRPAAVAGYFYPQESAGLLSQVQKLLAENTVHTPPPKALIVPHAGYVYSGPIAARAYNALAGLRGTIRRVVLLGPAHRVALHGLALPSVEAFQTPLGDIRLDRQAAAQLEALPQIMVSDQAHALEHSLEVQLPFLQAMLVNFTLVPLVVGQAQAAEVAEVLEKLWDGKETLVVISSDLSHYHPSDRARQLDAATANHIENLDSPISEHQACGAHPVNGLLQMARRLKLHVQRLDLRNSGDTAGTPERVVGYGAWAFYEV